MVTQKQDPAPSASPALQIANSEHLAIVVLSSVADETDRAPRRQRGLMRTLRKSP
jgi:hypothetical protein